MQSASAANGGHLKGLLRVHDLWIAADQLVKLRRRVHLLPKIQIVVRSGAVSAQAYGKILFQHLRYGRDARSELHV